MCVLMHIHVPTHKNFLNQERQQKGTKRGRLISQLAGLGFGWSIAQAGNSRGGETSEELADSHLSLYLVVILAVLQ